MIDKAGSDALVCVPVNLAAYDKTSFDVFWLKDKSLTDLDNLPEPDDLAESIIENLEAELASFREVLSGLAKAG